MAIQSQPESKTTRYSRCIARVDSFLLVKPGRNTDLDGIRAIAITLVILIHTYVYSTLPNQIPDRVALLYYFGWVGVPLFFTLSGYLVGGAIYREVSEGKFSFRQFYLNRSLRILPVAYIFIILTSWNKIGFNRSTFLNFSYLINYFTLSAWHGHLWSLCIEEHFYFLFPLLVTVSIFVFPSLRRSNSWMTFISILILAQFALRIGLSLSSGSNLQIIFRSTHTNMDFFLFGIIAEQWVRSGLIRRDIRFGRIYPILIVLSYVFLAKFHFDYQGDKKRPFFILGYPLIGLWCFIFLMGVLTQKNFLNTIFARPIFRWIAICSYSMYLWHDFVFKSPMYHNALFIMQSHLSSHLSSKWVSVPLITVLNFVVALVLGLMSFIFLERPFLKLRARLTNSKVRLHPRLGGQSFKTPSLNNYVP